MATGKRKYLIWGSAAVLAGIIGYTIWKKRKGKAKEECIKNGGTYDDKTKTCTLPTKVDVGVNNEVVTPPVVNTTPYVPFTANPFTTKPELIAFQQYVINTKGDKTILGKGGSTGFGDDGSWGRNSAAAYDKYGVDYQKNKPVVTATVSILPSDALSFQTMATYLGTPTYFSSNGVGRYTKRNFTVNMSQNTWLTGEHPWLLFPLQFFVFEADSDQPEQFWRITNNADKEIATGNWEQSTKSLAVWTSNFPNVIKVGAKATTNSTQESLTVLFGNKKVTFV
jgi:hypothetical protein